ncbi:pyridoxal-dependent decarboxylase [Hyaloraphidium curvatum]|nr:pyridoxal-dependent decarboxylase [Hyaloraphidium curvatum]
MVIPPLAAPVAHSGAPAAAEVAANIFEGVPAGADPAAPRLATKDAPKLSGPRSPVDTLCGADGRLDAAAADSRAESFSTVVGTAGMAPEQGSLGSANSAKSFLPELVRRTCGIAEVLERRLDEIHAGADDEDAHEDAFFAGDIGEVVRQYAKFRKLLPRVVPHYAVKCNPDDTIVKALVELGASFDCASKGEIDQVLKFGVNPQSIIYANPCKPASHLRAARAAGVDLMTFDNADELAKIRRHHPGARLVLRILTDDSRSVCRFGIKFGADAEAAAALLALAKEMGMDVVGVSFHVGSGCYDATAFRDAVVAARAVFDEAKAVGYDLELLDVGGGFPGSKSTGITFEQIAAVLGPAIDELFPPSVRVIAEPGRYFVSAAYTLAVNITARRVVHQAADPARPATPALAGAVPDSSESDAASTLGGDAASVAGDPDKRLPGPGGRSTSSTADRAFMYYINDGTYGSFNCIYFDHVQPVPRVLSRAGAFLYDKDPAAPEHACSIWGPTCDSMDCITKNGLLPELGVGDWLYFEDMGAYTTAAGSEFNGFRKSRVEYTNTEAELMREIVAAWGC